MDNLDNNSLFDVAYARAEMDRKARYDNHEKMWALDRAVRKHQVNLGVISSYEGRIPQNVIDEELAMMDSLRRELQAAEALVTRSEVSSEIQALAQVVGKYAKLLSVDMEDEDFLRVELQVSSKHKIVLRLNPNYAEVEVV